MLSFEPLRILMKERGVSSYRLRKDCGISSNAATALNNDQPVRTETIETLCKYFDVPIEKIVVFISDSSE